MDEFLLLACLFVFVIILTRINRQYRRIEERLDEFEVFLKKQSVPQPVVKPDISDTPLSTVEVPPIETPVEPYIPTPAFVFEEYTEQTFEASTHEEERHAPEQVYVYTPTESWWDKFKVRNPDLEKFIGENLISKIGIAILVLGIAFFVKYAIDKNWIHETARVGIGFLCGALVNFVAHRLRRKFKAFSSVLVAGAIAIYYFTIAIAFQEYHLFGQAVAFGLMIVITAFSLLVSISYNREELAVLSLIGGFATPLMVSTGSGNYIVLFSYLLILDIGILILAYLRKWNIVNLCTFGFTLLFYGVWFFTRIFDKTPLPGGTIGSDTVPYAGAFIFATLFYLVFTAMILVNDLKEKRQTGTLELTLFLANTAIYYSIGMYLMGHHFTQYKGVFTSALAIVNLAIGWVLYKHFKADKKLVYLLIGLALTFVTLAAPVQLEGNNITLFWAAESVLLLWLSLKSELRNFLYSSVIVSVLMVISLLIDWFQYYTGIVHADLPAVFNKLFLTGIFACACLLAKNKILNRQENPLSWLSITVEPKAYQNWLHAIALILLYFVCQLELNFQLGKTAYTHTGQNIVLGAFHMLYCTLLTVYFYYHRNKKMLTAAYMMSTINIVLYAVVLASMHQVEMDDSITVPSALHIGFKIHFISLLCVITLIYYLFRLLVFHGEGLHANKKFMSWLLAIAVVLIGSMELTLNFSAMRRHDLLLLEPSAAYVSYSYLKTQLLKIGYPILWSILSIFFLIYGIKRQNKSLRICSLVLQAITILKLFIYDINNVSEAGKIVAFIILGVILLLMSFMYQKIRAIIFSDENTEKI